MQIPIKWKDCGNDLLSADENSLPKHILLRLVVFHTEQSRHWLYYIYYNHRILIKHFTWSIYRIFAKGKGGKDGEETEGSRLSSIMHDRFSTNKGLTFLTEHACHLDFNSRRWCKIFERAFKSLDAINECSISGSIMSIYWKNNTKVVVRRNCV